MKSIPFRYFILSCMSFSLFLRFKWSSNSTGMDSFHYLDLSNRLVEYGSIWWFYDILSLIDQYPLSESTGLIVLYSSLTMVCNVNVEYTIFLISELVGITYFCAGLLAGKKFFNSSSKGILIGLVLCFSPLFLWESMNTFSQRIFVPLMLLLTMVVFYTMQISNFLRLSFLMFILLITMSTIHKLFIIVYIFILFLILTKVMIYRIDSLYKSIIYSNLILFSPLILLLISYIVTPLLFPFYSIYEGETFLTTFSKLIITFTSSIGPFSFLPIITFLCLLNNVKLTEVKPYLPFFISFALISPLLFSYAYTKYIVVVVAAIFSPLGLFRLMKFMDGRFNSMNVRISLVFFFTTIVFFAAYPHLSVDDNSNNHVTASNYNTAIFLSSDEILRDEIIYSDNAGTPVNTVRAYSNVLLIPASQPVYLLIEPIKDEFDSKGQVVTINTSRILTDPKDIYDFDLDMKYGNRQILRYFLADAKDETYNSVSNDFEYLGINYYLHFNDEGNIIFFESTREIKYCIYQSESHLLFTL